MIFLNLKNNISGYSKIIFLSYPMKIIILLSIYILCIDSNCKSQEQEMIKSYNNFEDLIAQKKLDHQQLKILSEFRKVHQAYDRFYVEEFKDCYRITVSHSSKEGYTGGTECYRLDKNTGKSEMLWHEHPMKTDE
jgi:hypothetical protein